MLAKLAHKTKLIYKFGREMKIDFKLEGRKSNRDKSMIKLLKSPAIKVSGISNIIFLSSDPNGLCNRLGLSLQEKQAGNIFDLTNEEIVAVLDKLLQYQGTYNNQHKQLFIKCYILHEQV